MLATYLALALAGLQNAPAPVTLERTWKIGETANYLVHADLYTENRQYGLETFLPSTQGFEYKFTTTVKDVKGGIASLDYKRPTMISITGENYESEEVRNTEKVNMHLLLDVSPINEILKLVDLKDADKKAAAAKDKKKPAKKGKANYVIPGTGPTIQDLGQFSSEVYRLAIFFGPLNASLDFSPRLPLDEVKVGDTWLRTVGYSPQKLKGEGNKSAVQRLDYTYTYKGLIDSELSGRKVQRVEATLNIDNDIAGFLNDAIGMTKNESGLQSYKLKLKATILYDLDPVTLATLNIDAKSEGAINITATMIKSQDYSEVRVKGHSTLKRL